ncbi:MAG: DUF2332 family protein, partial [Sandarakinorhabdus sp.]|nr:DUF2332 family protein [Sandarakinorhabdus sp.]
AQAQLPIIDCSDAADWVEANVAPVAGSTAVVFHSIAFQYFPPRSQARIAAHMAAIGGAASAAAPVAWLRFEMDDPSLAQLPTLQLTLWAGGDARETLLAHVHPHGAFVQWR